MVVALFKINVCVLDSSASRCSVAQSQLGCLTVRVGSTHAPEPGQAPGPRAALGFIYINPKTKVLLVLEFRLIH